MPGSQPLEPSDIWTSDGRLVRGRSPFGVPEVTPGQVVGAMVIAPVAVSLLAAGAAITAGVVAAGVASAAARSLLGGAGLPPTGVGARWGGPGIGIVVVDVRSRAPGC